MTNKLTTPQQKMKDRFDRGERIKLINEHHVSGGRYVWDNGSDELCSYKVFWNMIGSIYGFGKPIPDRLKYFVK
jgi:hypothetical protein